MDDPPIATAPSAPALLCGGLTLLLAAPFAAHLTWRPLAVALGSRVDGVAALVSLSAVGIAAATAALAAWDDRRGAPAWGWTAGAALSLVLGALVAGLAGALSLLSVSLATAALSLGMARRIDATWATRARPPARLALASWAGLMLACIAASTDLATYLGDPPAVGHGIAHGTELYRHFCASAYLHAAQLVAGGVGDVYDPALVPAFESELLPDTAAHMAPFLLDRFGYPPQFLLLPMASSALVGDFAAWRALWTCANGLFFAGLLWRLGFWVGPRSGRVLRYSAPALWVLGGIVYQSGNVQLTVIGVGLLAMIAAREGRPRTGGLLLAMAILAKIAPGLLGVVLLVQRRGRAFAWTVAWALLLTVLTYAITGPEVFVAFVEGHLPAISTGRAYDFLDDTPRVILDNLSPFGLPFKLSSLGVDLDPWAWGPRVASAYTLLAVGLAVLAGRRPLDRRGSLAIWALVLTVAGLRSPMAPGYLLAGVQLGLALVGAEVRSLRGWVTGGLLFGALMLTTPLLPNNLWAVLAGQAIMHGTIVWLVLRRWPALDAPASAGSADPAPRPALDLAERLTEGLGHADEDRRGAVGL